MNTIYDGTFVLGNTSATTYQAGPGISITQPSEGTIRIANDETVLWSGHMGWGQNGSLTESVKNFERIRFYVEDSQRHRKATNELVLTDLSTTALRQFSLNMPDASTTFFGNYFTVFEINEDGNSLSSITGRQWWFNPWTATNIAGDNNRGLYLNEVIGINRISGSNT